MAESKARSTPFFTALVELGGFPTDVGAYDSHTATLLTLREWRAVLTDDVQCFETIPSRYHMWRVRRTQHLVQHSARTINIKIYTKGAWVLRLILALETYPHLVIPG